MLITKTLWFIYLAPLAVLLFLGLFTDYYWGKDDIRNGEENP